MGWNEEKSCSDSLISIAQTANRISMFPNSAVSEINKFDSNFPLMMKIIEDQIKPDSPIHKYVELLKSSLPGY